MSAPQNSQNPTPSSPHGMALVTAPERMKALWSAATVLASTNAVPSHFRGRPGEVFAAMLTLDALGAHPIGALGRCYEVQGNPGVQAKLKIAAALARGAFAGPITYTATGAAGPINDKAGPRQNAVDPGNLSVTARATLHGNEAVVVEQTVTLKDAVQMGWTKRGAKGGPNARWEVPAMQVRMLQWRAADWLIELYAPHTTNGVRAYEELADMADAGELAPRDVALEPGADLNVQAGLVEPPQAAEPEPTESDTVEWSDAAPPKRGRVTEQEIPF